MTTTESAQKLRNIVGSYFPGRPRWTSPVEGRIPTDGDLSDALMMAGRAHIKAAELLRAPTSFERRLGKLSMVPLTEIVDIRLRGCEPTPDEISALLGQGRVKPAKAPDGRMRAACHIPHTCDDLRREQEHEDRISQLERDHMNERD